MKIIIKLLGLVVVSVGLVCSNVVLADDKFNNEFKIVPAQPKLSSEIKLKVQAYCNSFGEKMQLFAAHREAGVPEAASIQHYRLDVAIYNKMMILGDNEEALASKEEIEQTILLHKVIYNIPEEHFTPSNVISIIQMNVQQCEHMILKEFPINNPFSQ